VRRISEEKLDLQIFKTAIQQRVSYAEFESIKQIVERVQHECINKAQAADLERTNEYIKGQFDTIAKELLLRATVKDLCILLDQKANLVDVNKTLEQVQVEIDACAKEKRVKDALNDQALVNEALCAENCTGRWIWKTGDLLHANQIPWEVQAINTCPDNFLWDKNKSAIVLVAPGLYQLSIGFYSRKLPKLKVYVNNEVIFTILPPVTDANKENHAVDNRNVITARHSAGNIAGLTFTDFVALPARARLSIGYDSDTLGEGFF